MMRIVIDMQGAQTESRFRGIGRYTMSFTQAVVRNRGEHEIILALSGLFPDTIEHIRAAFDSLLPQENIRVWHGIGPTRECNADNGARRVVAESFREAAIACMRPDVILVSSLFEGLGDDAITSIGRFDERTPVAAILYDLIPLISPDEHFRSNPIHIGYYQRKIESLRKCSALLSISESSRNEALSVLDYPENKVINISSGVDPRFTPHVLSSSARSTLLAKFGINKRYVMYTGGADERKNLDRLIEAFSVLPTRLRDRHQMLFVGKMPEGHVVEYQAKAKLVGLRSEELVFSGYVSDLELMQLYSACQLFVFPSLHEGFGLPPLEAMGCGAPVIASNVTSLPEVIGREDVLFNPHSVSSIATKMEQVLDDENFRAELIGYGAMRVNAFSWDASARKAISAMEAISRPAYMVLPDGIVQESRTGIFRSRELRILVSKLDHMGDLVLAIPAISRLRARYPDARIDAIVGSWNCEAAKELGVFEAVYTLDYFSKKSAVAPNANQEMDDLIEEMIYYDIAVDLRRQCDTRFILTRIPAKIRAGYAVGDMAIDVLLDVCLPASVDVPFKTTEINCTSIAIQMLRLVDALPAEPNDFIKIDPPVPIDNSEPGDIAVFPNAGNAVKEWGTENFVALLTMLEKDPSIQRIGVFVGSEAEASAYRVLPLSKVMVHCALAQRALYEAVASYHVCVANNSYGVHLASWCGLRVVGIYGGHETVAEWGPVFGNCRVLHVPVPCSPCHIPDRNSCPHALKCLTSITPEHVLTAIHVAQADVDRVFASDLQVDLIGRIGWAAESFSLPEICALTECIERNIPLRSNKRLFVDVSELVVRDARTGIQRVVRNILQYLLDAGAEKFEVFPVYATSDLPGFRIARSFMSNWFGIAVENWCEDELLDYQPGDVFLGLDLCPVTISAQANYLQMLRRCGVLVYFVVYDLLCDRMPDYFEMGPIMALKRWLEVVAESDGALCISKSVADDLADWVKNNGHARQRSFRIDWWHLGADMHCSASSPDPLPSGANQQLKLLSGSMSCLMVGTLEPRKGHAQVLDAFEQLWQSGVDVNLVIAGKQGWMVETLVDRLRVHPELNKRLFWLEGISDEYLEKVYAASTCLIAASYGEGFGLPLIEAAQHKLPIIARDIPVFREVAGEYAYYFNSTQPEGVAESIQTWISLYENSQHPKSDAMPWLTWKESAAQLQEAILTIGE